MRTCVSVIARSRRMGKALAYPPSRARKEGWARRKRLCPPDEVRCNAIASQNRQRSERRISAQPPTADFCVFMNLALFSGASPPVQSYSPYCIDVLYIQGGGTPRLDV